MAKKPTRETLRQIRTLQRWAPVSLLVISVLVFWLWKDEMSGMVSAVIAFLAIPDYFAFKIVGDQIEARLNET